MLLNTVFGGEGRGTTMYILNSILFAYGGEENVEMHGIHFDLACCGDWNKCQRQGIPPLEPPQFLKSLFYPCNWRQENFRAERNCRFCHCNSKVF